MAATESDRLVVFVAPFVFDTTLRFVRAAAAVPGIDLVLVSRDPLSKFPNDLRQRLGGHWRVDELTTDALITAVRGVAARAGRPVHRLLGTLEQLQVPLAAVREALGIEGMGPEKAQNFRDKAQMKDRLRAAGVPCARHRLLRSADDARDFVAEVGYPLVIKPPAGAGAKATYRVERDADLERVLVELPFGPAAPLLAEEFIQGEEFSFDGASIDGRLVWHSITQYLPTPLEVVRNPWIQWCVLLPREVDEARFDEARSAAVEALDALGMGTGVSHLEWFRRADGSVAVSEVGARPGGAQISKLMSYAHGFDFYRAWAGLMIDGSFEPPPRRHAAGAAFLRGQGRGNVRRVRGLREAQKVIGHLVVETNLPRLGQPASSSYEGEGYVILRHEETRVVEDALRQLISLMRVELG
ncbi:MAG: ATP-grasp domain-containing protein [Acidobacteriota bacterium]